MDLFWREMLNTQYRKFKKKIMGDYVRFNESYSNKSGFLFLEISSREYELQKFFEVRIEDYIRNILVNDVLRIALEEKGFDVDFASIPEDNCDTDVCYSNVEYENITGYEFIANFGYKKVMFRYTHIDQSKVDQLIADVADELIILDWSVPGRLPSSEKNSREIFANDNTNTICIRELFENFLGINEYENYISFLTSAIIEYQEFLGVMSVPKLSPYVMGTFRFEVERNFVEYLEKVEKLNKADEQIKKSGVEYANGITYGYQIIDDENKDEFSVAENTSKELLIKTGILDEFKKNKLYRYLLGKSDFSRSLFTSEYLYKQYDADDCFDYTAIVSGYLKSVEQLLYHIAKFSIDKKYEIKNRSFIINKGLKKGKYGKLIPDKHKPFRIKWTTENAPFADTTIGALIWFLKDNKDDLLHVEEKYKDVIIDCLNCYRIECRNDSFHLDNNYRWSRVEYIRWNTFFLYIILLSCCKLGDNDAETLDSLQVVRNDKMERVCDLIFRGVTRTFDFYFHDKNGVQNAEERVVFIPGESDYPSYNNIGVIISGILVFESIDTKKKIIITKHNVPSEIWWINGKGDRILIE